MSTLYVPFNVEYKDLSGNWRVYSDSQDLTYFTLPNNPVELRVDFESDVLQNMYVSEYNVQWDVGDYVFEKTPQLKYNYITPGVKNINVYIARSDGLVLSYGDVNGLQKNITVTVKNFLNTNIRVSSQTGARVDVGSTNAHMITQTAGKPSDAIQIYTQHTWQLFDETTNKYGVDLHADQAGKRITTSGSRGNVSAPLKTSSYYDNKYAQFQKTWRFTTDSAGADPVDHVQIEPVKVYARLNDDRSGFSLCEQTAPGAMFAGTSGTRDVYYVDDSTSYYDEETEQRHAYKLMFQLDTTDWPDSISNIHADTKKIKQSVDRVNTPQLYQAPHDYMFVNVTPATPTQLVFTSTGIADHEVSSVKFQNTSIPFVISLADQDGNIIKHFETLSPSAINYVTPWPFGLPQPEWLTQENGGQLLTDPDGQSRILWEKDTVTVRSLILEDGGRLTLDPDGQSQLLWEHSSPDWLITDDGELLELEGSSNTYLQFDEPVTLTYETERLLQENGYLLQLESDITSYILSQATSVTESTVIQPGVFYVGLWSADTILNPDNFKFGSNNKLVENNIQTYSSLAQTLTSYQVVENAVLVALLSSTETGVVSGYSKPFNINPHTGKDVFFKFGEEIDYGEIFNSYILQENINQHGRLQSLFNAVFGEFQDLPSALGKVLYERIHNFTSNTVDLDTCDVNSLYGLADEVDYEIARYNLSYPGGVKRLVNMLSTGIRKLTGDRKRYDDDFDQDAVHVGAGKYRYGRNISEHQLSTNTYMVTAGHPIVVKELFGNNTFKVTPSFVSGDSQDVNYITEQNINALSSYPLSAYENSWNWGLTYPADGAFDDYYEFYDYVSNDTYDIDRFDQGSGLVNWTETNRLSTYHDTLSENTTQYDQWYGNTGVIQTSIEFALRDGLQLISTDKSRLDSDGDGVIDQLDSAPFNRGVTEDQLITT